MSAGNKIGYGLDSFGFGKPPAIEGNGGEEPAGNWWEAGGATGCIQALQPKGAADYAASLLDLSGNENDAAEGTAPDWDADNGWKFNGSDDYLDTGLINDGTYTMIVRFSNAASGTGYACGTREGNNHEFFIAPNFNDGEEYIDVVRRGYGDNGSDIKSPNMTNGVYALAGNNTYRDGVSDDPISGTWGEVVPEAETLYIGGYSSSGLNGPLQVYIQAFAIYDNTLDADEVAAVSTAMAAL